MHSKNVFAKGYFHNFSPAYFIRFIYPFLFVCMFVCSFDFYFLNFFQKLQDGNSFNPKFVVPLSVVQKRVTR